MLLRLNDGESVTVYSRKSNSMLVIASHGDVIGCREFLKNDNMDLPGDE